MPVPTLGPWQLAVADLSGETFERFLGFDGEQVAWVWRIADWALDRGPRLDGDALSTGRAQRAIELLEAHYQGWQRLAAPWLKLSGVAHGQSGTALVSEHVGGVRLAELIEAQRQRPMPLAAAAWIAAGLARALGQLDDSSFEGAPDLCASSILIDWEGQVRPCPWPDLAPLPRVRTLSGTVAPFEYFTPEQLRDADLEPGWRVWAPSVVLLHALTGAPPHKAESALLTARNVIEHHLADPSVLKQLPAGLGQLVAAALGPTGGRPALDPLVRALEACASRGWLDQVLARDFASERSEQLLELAKARGEDREQLPPELAHAVISERSDAAFGVLGDWLQTQGLPRGELAALQLRLEKGADLEVSRAEAELLGGRRTLLPAVLRERLAQWRGEWRAGWLVSLELRVVPKESELTEILSHPTLRFLHRLRVAPDARGSLTVAKVVRALSLPALKQVELGSGLATHGAWLKEVRADLEVLRSKDVAPLPLRRRPEASDPEARVGVEERREPLPAAEPEPLLRRVRGWFTRDE